ncbi:MAG TPA: ATP-binding protein [Polyangiaceae bacterium]|nr:ATP-binding protein [Polyangiaceae bacterium]
MTIAEPRERPSEDLHAAGRINLSWLLRLRLGAVLGQAVVIAYVEWGLHIGLPLAPLAAILGLELGLVAASVVWIRQRLPTPEPVVAAAVALDVTCFTGLLYFTGGPLNPFSFLYLVHIALSAIVLRQRWAWGLVLFSVAASAALFVRHVPLPMDHGMHHGMHHHVDGSEPLDLHLRGMWVAFAVAAAFIVYFIDRVTRALRTREAELARAQELAARTEKLAAMATLAAGAAHELATPLSTIAVVAKELERAADATVAADARLVREQVQRCRTILSQMAGGAGTAEGEAALETSLSELVRVALDGLAAPDRVDVEWAPGVVGEDTLVVPVRAVAQALRNVLSNAADASPADRRVLLRVSREGGLCRFEVVDRGSGMSADVLAHASEPFFTTKEPGRGMGLGLFLTRSVLDLLGGRIEIDSVAGRGTRVTLTLPWDPATIDRIAAHSSPFGALR